MTRSYHPIELNVSNLLVFTIAAILAAIPLPFLKEFNVKKDIIYIGLSLLSYILLIATYIYITKQFQISTVYPLIKIISILIVTLSGLVFFRESLTMKQALGILLAIVAIYLLSY